MSVPPGFEALEALALELDGDQAAARARAGAAVERDDGAHVRVRLGEVLLRFDGDELVWLAAEREDERLLLDVRQGRWSHELVGVDGSRTPFASGAWEREEVEVLPPDVADVVGALREARATWDGRRAEAVREGAEVEQDEVEGARTTSVRLGDARLTWRDEHLNAVELGGASLHRTETGVETWLVRRGRLAMSSSSSPEWWELEDDDEREREPASTEALVDACVREVRAAPRPVRALVLRFSGDPQSPPYLDLLLQGDAEPDPPDASPPNWDRDRGAGVLEDGLVLGTAEAEDDACTARLHEVARRLNTALRGGATVTAGFWAWAGHVEGPQEEDVEASGVPLDAVSGL